MRRLLVLVAGCAALGAAPAAVAAPAVAVRTALEPRAVLFADPVDVRIDAIVDPALVDPSKTELTVALGPWTQVGPTRVETDRAGALVRRRFVLVLACRSDACAPFGAERVAKLPTAVVSVARRDGTTRRVPVAWPSLVVASRLPAGAASASTPPFDLQTTPPAVHTWIGASTAAAILDAVAAVLAAAAVLLVVLAVRRRRVPAPDPRTPFERALELAREAEARPAPDRRRALALLARVGRQQDAGYAADAASAAWRPDAPSAERIADLVGRGERLEEDA